MFHKRLMKEFKENQKYVAGMVITQWVSLLCNVCLMLAVAGVIEGVFVRNREFYISDVVPLLVTLLLVSLIRMAMTTLNTRLSFQASSKVKLTLRERIYEKLMQLGSNYRDVAPTSEVVQISTEGVDQLEIYFGKYVPQFFYSLLAPITLFVIVGTMNIKTAVVLFLCVPLIPISIVAVQKFAKKLLAKYWGSYTELGDSVSNKYLCFIGGDTPICIVESDVPGPTCIVLKESYGKAIVPFLTSHYGRIIVIDPREFTRDGKPSLNLAEFAADQGVDDLIVINYPYMINSKAFIRYLNALAGVQ